VSFTHHGRDARATLFSVVVLGCVVSDRFAHIVGALHKQGERAGIYIHLHDRSFMPPYHYNQHVNFFSG
jgi:hypothetical protein